MFILNITKMNYYFKLQASAYDQCFINNYIDYSRLIFRSFYSVIYFIYKRAYAP